MKIVLAVLLPPVAVLLCGKPFAFLFNIALCFLFLIPGIVHALYVVAQYDAEQRQKRTVKTLQRTLVGRAYR